ncbi:30S ribosomal protein S6 [bacterium]|nr:30S ribosomal protein S6 [candidate division CSSED10-310 bacterium]
MNPAVTEEDVEAFVDNLRTMINNLGGQLVKIEKWGKRQLAYEVDKFKQGYYVLLLVSSSSEVITEMERRYRITDAVIKYMTVLADEHAADRITEVKTEAESEEDEDKVPVARPAPPAVKPVPEYQPDESDEDSEEDADEDEDEDDDEEEAATESEKTEE